jgi:ATP-dependent Lon protease
VKSHASEIGIDERALDGRELHVHVPAGAIPKDGPSAGITMATALVSLLTGRHVRDAIAMTGEMTLTGQVLPIGGLKDKALAAQRNGISTIIAPELNEQDTDEIPEHLRKKLEFCFVAQIDDVLEVALEPDPPPAPSTSRVRAAAGRNGDRVYAREKPESKRNASDQR